MQDANDGLILPPQMYWYLWSLSWLSFVSGLVATYRGYYDLSLVPFGVWLTSINYWRRPDFSWRRYVDMGYVGLSLSYQLYRAIGAQYMVEYYAITLAAVACFPLAVFLHWRLRRGWPSTICHGMIHILGNVANVTLYAGHVRSIADASSFAS